MGKWIRVEDNTGIEKVSLAVKRDIDPDVYEWLVGLPYGKTTHFLKQAIRHYIASGGGASPRQVAPATPSPATPAPATHLPAHSYRDVAQPAVAAVAQQHQVPAAVIQPHEAGHLDEIDPETLKLMQEMNGRFG